MSNNTKSAKPYRFIMNLTYAEKRWIEAEAKKQNTSMATIIRSALFHYQTVLDNREKN